jgi:cytochrome c553
MAFCCVNGLNSSRKGPWIVKHFRTKMAVLAISFATTGPLLADDLSVRNCTWCHGTSAQGYSKAPRLAGQRADYLVNQLQAFATHKRDEFLSPKYMWNAAAHLDPLTLQNLAAYFSALPPEAAKDGDSALAAEGKIIFEDGVPNENIAACQACHGPEAQGVREIPRLGGLSYSYLKRRLEEWSLGQDAWGIPMPKVARSLSPTQIAAVASYLSFVGGESSEK